MKALSKSNLRYAGILLSAATLLTVQEACTYKKAVEDTATPCNMPAVLSYKTDVYPILKVNCRDKCHNDASAAQYNNFSMDHFSQVYYWCTTTPGNGFNDPWLIGNIEHESGYSNMPVGAAQLSQCDRAIIEAWVKQGALEN